MNLCRHDLAESAKSADFWLSGRHVADMSATFPAKTETKKEWGGKYRNSKGDQILKLFLCGRRKHESAVLRVRTDRTRVFWPRQKSHRLFLPGEVILVCWSQIRSPQNSTSTIWPFYSTVITPHGTSFAVVKRNKQIRRPREPYFSCCQFSFWSVEKHIAP